ncbi:MAG: alpha-amylase family glycosyl hydrolase [Candidatus Baltobacteraceae bacterium]|jgi:glycosidase
MLESVWGADVQGVINSARANGLTPSPADWRDGWIYFLLVDRFNNPRAPVNHLPFDDPAFSGFQGGTYSGVRAQLPYIKKLGAGAIWLSPVLRNVPADQTYHGYGIHDFLVAEKRFADNPAEADRELRDLVDAAHAAGLYVIFDVVLNHTGDVFHYPGDLAQAPFQSAPVDALEWRDETGEARADLPAIENVPNPSRDGFVWPSELQRNAYFRRQGMPQAGGDDTVGDFDSLKQLLTADPNVQRTLIRAYQYVVARFDVDGFRIDTLRYLKGDLARIFGNAMREFALEVGKKNFFTYGEVWSSEDDIAHFIGRVAGDTGDLVGVDAALDYPLFYALPPAAKGFAPPAAVAAMYEHRKSVEADILSSHGDATRYFVTFLDNHDQNARIRYVAPGNEHAFDDQVTLALASLLSLPGIPCVYYGTEQGLHGSGGQSEAVREALWGGPGFDATNPFFRQLASITAVRNARPALRYGRFYFRPISGNGTVFGISPYSPGVLAFSRILNDEEVVVVANASSDPAASVTVKVIVDAQLNAVPASFDVLYSNKPGARPSVAVQTIPGAVVNDVDGTVSNGAVNAITVTLAPLEAQILGRSLSVVS